MNTKAREDVPPIASSIPAPPGNSKEHAAANLPIPKWAKYHGKMSSEFPSPFRGTSDPLAHQIEKFVERLDKLPAGARWTGFSGQEWRSRLQIS